MSNSSLFNQRNILSKFVCTECGVNTLEAYLTSDESLVDIGEMVQTIKDVWDIDVSESYCRALLAFLNVYAREEEINGEQTITKQE